MKNKTLSILIVLIFCCITGVYSQSTNQNYILTRTMTNESGSTYLDKIEYFNNKGQSDQVVLKNGNPNNADLITKRSYDESGRLFRESLPIVITENNGAYVSSYSPSATYGSHERAYAEYTYEGLTLNRVLEELGPGISWHTGRKSVKYEYMINKGTTGELSCAKFLVDGVKVKKDGFLTNGYLYVTKRTDEDGNLSYEFKNNQDQIILTRQKNGTEYYDTYYVYDNWDNLCFVLPPEASAGLISGNGSWDETNVYIKNYAYIYKYDKRDRCIYKKLPGCDPIYYVYDKADRLIFVQDGEHRSTGKWLFSIPDSYGRTVLTGTCTNSLNYQADPLGSVVIKGVWTKATNAYKGYTISGITLGAPTILSTSYYDSYEFIGLNAVPNNTNVQYVAQSGYGTQYTGSYKGLLTGSLTGQMSADGSVSTTYLYSAMYYDYKGQIIQSKSNNHLAGGIEKSYTAYNFTGQPLKQKNEHLATGKTTQTEEYIFTYDHTDRLIKKTHKLNSGSIVVLNENTYDNLGRLATDKRNGNTNFLTTYSYNIRSWVTGISNPLFRETIGYERSVGMDAPGYYNGKITSNYWKYIGDPIDQGYNLTYDNLSRMTAAKFWIGGSYRDNFKVQNITYDRQGNLKTLQRYGNVTATTYGLVDNLTMTYVGNQLTKIEDAVGIISLPESADFKNYSNVVTEYTYNKNGALTKDLNKGISSIQYNSLNLPRMMDIKSPVAEARNEYVYSASGSKLKVVQKWNSNFSTVPVIGSAINTAALNMSKTTDYVGNKIYENGSLKRILIDGGYIENGIYYFYLADHLGNTRIVANSSGTVIQKNQYYPFGMAFAENTNSGTQPYKYNGKELDTMHGLNQYDYSARYYDPAFCRFTTVDPMAEKYYSWSPYGYVLNNPLKYIDPTGMEVYYDQQGKRIGQVGENTDVRVLNSTVSNEDALSYISSGSEESITALMDGSVAFADYFTTVNDVTNDAALIKFAGNCYAAAKSQMEKAGYSIEGSNTRIDAKVDNQRQPNLEENPFGAAIKIMTDLKNGKPVMVGVEHSNEKGWIAYNKRNWNENTGHFVVVRSSNVEANGVVTFNILDNAFLGGKSSQNNLTLNMSTGYIKGNMDARQKNLNYTISEVRKSK